MKNIDYILRNDLAVQNRKYKKINTYIQNDIKVEEYIYKEFSFVDVFFKNVETNKSKNVLKGILISELKKIMKKYALKKSDSCLVVGLGNKNIISDALGPKTSENIIATGYFELLNIADYRNVYAYVPGTTKESGMEPFKGVKALVKELRPSFVIIIDSLVCSHIKYLNSVVQISDYGIRPGSGLTNYSKDRLPSGISFLDVKNVPSRSEKKIKFWCGTAASPSLRSPIARRGERTPPAPSQNYRQDG